jgi:hypothetical protein
MKFTPEGGRIGGSITLSEGGFVDIAIWDTRVGIAKGEIEKNTDTFRSDRRH